MKNLNINKNIMESMRDINGAFKSGSKNTNFEYFLRNQIAIEASKYPFLSKVQIKKRILSGIRKGQNTQQKLKTAKCEKKSERQTVSDLYGLKVSPAKLRSKRPLVPLNVDFISVRKNEVPKRKLTSTGRKQVSFNKDLSVHYRTTSEESSNGTLKLKKSIKKEKDAIIFSPTDKPRNHNLSYQQNKPSRMQRYKQEEIFNQLVKSCSWSYKSLNTSKRFPMEKLKAQRTIKATESPNVAQSESELNASDKDSVDENDISDSFKDDPVESTKLEEVKYLNMTTEDELENFPKMTSTPYTRKKLNRRNARKISTERSSSSDSDEIFQTRLSVGNGHILNKEQENIHYNSPVKYVEKSNEKHIQDFKTNNTPIIIQARAYDKDVIPTYSENAKLNTKSKQEMSNGLKNQKEKCTSRDSLNVEPSYTDAELSDSYNQDSLENFEEVNCERREQFHQERGNNEILNELVNNINTFSEKNSTGATFQSPKETPEDSIMQDFLNGSFDISFYKSNSILPKKNIETSMIPNDGYLGKRKCQTSHDTPNKISKPSPITIKRPCTKRATRVKKTTETTFKPEPEENKLYLKSKNAKGSQQRQKKTSKTLADSKSKTRKSRAKKKNEEDDVSYGILNKKTPLKRPRKYKRNSSLVASKKIKEIEQLEEHFQKKEINLDSETGESRIIELDNIESDTSNYNFQMKKNNYSCTTGNATNNANIHVSEFNYHPNVEDNSKGSSHPFLSRKSKENLCLPKYNKKDITNITFFDDNTSKNYLKDKNKKIEQKHWNSHQNELEYYPEKSPNLVKDTYYSKSKATNKNSETKQNEIFHSNKNSHKRNDDIQSIIRYNGPVTRHKKRTWDSLEKELLGDFDNSCRNVFVNEAFKKAKLITNPSVKSPDLYTSTNTRQIIKSATENGCYLQYGLNTGKNNFESGLANMTSQYSKASSSPYTKDIVPSCSKSVSIVEKTIAAMNKCTKKFIIPPKNDYQSKQHESFFNAESDYSNASPEALFQSNVTVMSRNNKHYYEKQIVGYLKSPEKNNRNFRHSDDVEQLKEINVLRKSYVATDSQARKLLNNEMNQTLVPSTREKYNPWNKLMVELHLNQNNKDEESQRKNFNLEDSKKLKCVTPIHNNFNKLSGKNQKRYTKKANFEAFNGNQYILNDKRSKPENSAKINNQYIDNYKRKEQEILEGIHNERLLSFELDSSNSDIIVVDNVKADTKPVDTKSNKNMMINLENEIESKKFSQPVNKTTEDATKVKRYVRSPTFHLQMEKQGKLKLVRASSNSSNTSEEIMKSNQNNLKVEKNEQNEHQKKSVERYKKYLRKKIEENSNFRNDINEDHKAIETKKEDGTVRVIETGIQKGKRTLTAEEEKIYKHFKNGMAEIPTVRNQIARDHQELNPIETKKSEGKVSKDNIVSQERKRIIDEDVFSISSDSESYSDQYKEVTGLFQDLFDEP